MFTSIPLRRTTLSALAILALVPAGASAKSHAKAAQVDDPTTAGATAQLSREAILAGQKLYGDKATPDQALSAYWTPERMKAAQPIEESPEFQEALKRYDAVDAQPPAGGARSRGQGHQAPGAGSGAPRQA